MAREVAAKRARIAAVRARRDLLDRQREAMEVERKRKLAEARAKRKPADKVHLYLCAFSTVTLMRLKARLINVLL